MREVIVLILLVLLVICIYHFAKTTRSITKSKQTITQLKAVQAELRALDGAEPSEELQKRVAGVLRVDSRLRAYVVDSMMKMPSVSSKYSREDVEKYITSVVTKA